MKGCELCKLPARMYCESDQASLCWACDAKVHSANFLVARHSRSLLCHVCQSPTPWKASGAKLGPTVSVCERCVDGCDGRNGRCGEEESEGGNDDEFDREDDLDDVDDDDDDDEDEDEGDEFDVDDEDGDNQVVPWSSTPPPPASSSSSSEESSSSRFSGEDRYVSLKRTRENTSDLRSDVDHLGCSSSQRNHSTALGRDGEATCVDSLRPSKHRRIEADESGRVRPGSRSAAIVESLRRLHQRDIGSGNDASAAIVGICKLSEDPEAVDLDSCESP